MSDLRAMVTNLLDALRHAGGEQPAEEFEADFVRRRWALELDDQLEVLAAIQRAAERSAVQPQSTSLDTQPGLEKAGRSSEPARVPELAPAPARLAPLAPFGPWVGTLPGKWAFLASVHELFDASTRAHLASALHQVFVDHLGYGPSHLDDTPRLINQTTLSHASVVARHEQFVIVLVESNYAGPYLSSYELIFTLHPRAVVFALERGIRVRVVTRGTASAAHQLGSRILHGRGKRSFPTDDPIVWARRLALLEPRPEDDARTLAQRAHDLLAASASEVCLDWDSAQLEPTISPGHSWETTAGYELNLFLQPDAVDKRLHLGLEAELRASLPWRSRDGFEVHYASYRVRSYHRDAVEAVRTKTSTRVVIDLDLVHPASTGESVGLTVPLSIVVPDDTGQFVLFGQPLVFCPREQASAIWEQEDEFRQHTDEEDPQREEIDEEDEDEEWSGPQEHAHPHAYVGAGLLPLLRWSVGRRLRWYGWKLAKTRFPETLTVNGFKAWLGRYRDEHGVARASSFAVLNYHLRPPVVPSLRVLPIPRAAPPPAWACLDLSSALPPGFAYPVAGARLGPGGVLATPALTAEGTLRLLVRSTEVTNPRVSGSGSSALRRAFIAEPLARWADLEVGALEDPLAAIGPPRRGQFVRTVAPSEDTTPRILLPPSLSYESQEDQRWSVDIPTHADLREEIEVLVSLGQMIDAGAALVRVPPHTWGTDPESDSHRLLRLDEVIRGPSGRLGAGTSQIIYSPPSLSGRLTRIDLTKVRDADGTLLAYRVSFETTATAPIDRALLPDGRIAPIEIVSVEDLPWNARTGEPAMGAILDPTLRAAQVSDPSVEGETPSQWYDGATGEPLELVEILDALTFASCRPLGPDPALRLRVIDNWGLPRADADPQLNLAYLRWLQAAHPDTARDLYEIVTAHAGVLPAATSAAQLAVASCVAPPFFAPEAPEESSESLGPYDPRRRSGHPERWCGERSPGGIWEWRCYCGKLRGGAYAGISCASCTSPVVREPVHEPTHALELPVPIIHPWRCSLVAALLGLTVDELRPIMESEDCSELADITAAALEAPYRNLHRRLADTDDAALRTALLEQHAELDAALHHGLEFDELWLSKLEVLSPRLLFDGYRLGAPDLTQSPLTKRYRSIASVSELTSGRVEMLPQLRRAQWIELQRRVAELFGSLEDVEAGTLAEYWLRVWPTTAEAALPLSVPGLFASASPDDLQRQWSAALWPEAALAGTRRTHLGIVTAGEPLVLPEPPASRFDPTDADAWVEHGAWAELLDQHLIWLVAVLLGLDGAPRASRAVRTILPPDLADQSNVGRILLRELVRGLAPPAGRPTKLLELVLPPVPLRLPHSDRAAVESIEQRLVGLVDPGDTPALVSARALARILSGFWSGTPSADYPSGWLWGGTEHEAPKSFRRVVPRIDSVAWRLWPDYELMRDPLRALARGSVVQPRSPSVRAWFGLDAAALPVEVDWGQAQAPSKGQSAPEPSAVEPEKQTATPLSPPAEPVPVTQTPHEHEVVVVVEASLREWLAKSQS